MNANRCVSRLCTGMFCLLLAWSRAAVAEDNSRPIAVRIALIGDSTVATYSPPPAENPELVGWGQIFGEMFHDSVDVMNFAVSGRSSKSFLAEGKWQPVLDAKPDYVLIQFGHNDQPGKGDRTTDPNGDFQDNLRKYIDEARAVHVTPVLVTPVARRTFQDGKPSSSLPPYAQAMQKVGRERGVPVIDLHAASLELFGQLGDEGSADLSVSVTDRTHFSRKGGRAISRLVARQFPRAVPPLIPYLKPAAVELPAPGVSARVVPTHNPSEFPGAIRLRLPPVIYAVVGAEMNVYFDNVTLAINPANLAFDVQCAKGRQQQERWTLTPAAADVGEHPFQLDVRNDANALVARGGSVLRVVPAEAKEGKTLSVLMIGDSLTHASVYPQRLLLLSQKPGNPQVTLIGSHNPSNSPAIRHEGYGGWTAQRFATHAMGVPRHGEYQHRASPFLYPGADGKPALDFKAYCRDVNEGKFPEFVTIFLGPNDIFRDDDSTIETGVRTMLEHYDALIRMVHTAAPETVVGVMLPAPPAATQDAFGANYFNGPTRWQYKRNQHRLLEWMVERYGGREAEQIQIVPAYVNVDCLHGYPSETVKWNANTDQQGVRLNNGVHPSSIGYDQIGDAVFAWIKAQP